MTWTPEDQAIAELRAWLVEQGFVVLSDHYDPDHFGNQIVELSRPIAVRLVRDRSQWMIDIIGPDGEWADLSRWVPEVRFQSEVPSVADQAKLLRTRLPEIERRVEGEVERHRNG